MDGQKQPLDNARFFGLHGRDAIRPGLKADLNVIDSDALEVNRLYLVDDRRSQAPNATGHGVYGHSGGRLV